MQSRTTNTKRCRSGFTGASASRPLALLVAFALLLCHGFFGALHLFPADRVSAPELAAAQESPLAGVGSTHEDPVAGSVGEEYFAVLVVLLLGLLFAPSLQKTGPWCGRAAPRTYLGLCARLRVAHPARGPTGPLLQVFRL